MFRITLGGEMFCCSSFSGREAGKAGATPACPINGAEGKVQSTQSMESLIKWVSDCAISVLYV